MFSESRVGTEDIFQPHLYQWKKSVTGSDICLCADNDIMESYREAAVYPQLKICNPQLKCLAKILTVPSAWGVF